jgi:hypothetical protein
MSFVYVPQTGGGGGGAVTSVAGRTGDVVLAVADVSGAAPLAAPVFSSSLTLPSWTTAGRPSPAVAGMVGWNTDLARFDHCVAAGTPGTWKQFVRLDGDTLTGALTLAADPTNALHAATKQYVDGRSGVTSVAGRTGAVTLAVADVSGAAPLASPALTGTPTAPTPSTADNTTKIATTAYVQAQGYLTTIPTASTTTLGGVKVDGTSITITGGVISAVGGGGGAVTSVAGRTGDVVLAVADIAGAVPLAAQFGDGSDGDVTISGSVTLTRDMFYNNLTISSGAVLNSAGYRIFVKATLDLTAAPAGWLVRNGAAGSAGSGATLGAAAATLTSNTIGGAVSAGGGASGNTGAGVAGSGSGSPFFIGGGTLGTAGGGGGTGAGGAGGTSGSAGSNTQSAPLRVWSPYLLLRGAALLLGGNSGPGGGAGGGDGTNPGGGGGGGGSGGGIIFIAAATIARGAGTAAAGIQANGGAGGQGGTRGATGNCGGGGGGAGGAGGVVVIGYGALTGATATNMIQVNGAGGGDGGNGSGTGVAGTGGRSGGGGRVLLANLATGSFSETLGSAGSNGTTQTGASAGTLSVSL